MDSKEVKSKGICILLKLIFTLILFCMCPSFIKAVTDDNTLASLTFDSGTLSETFSSETTEYDLTLDTYVSYVTISGTLSDETATAVGFGKYYVDYGTTKTIDITVTSSSGLVNTYSIDATRTPLAEGTHSSKLLKLEIKGYESLLNPDFDSLTNEYSINILTNEIDLEIITETYDSEATVAISGDKYIKNATGTITITISEPNVENTIYTINYVKSTFVQNEYLFSYKENYQEFITPITGNYKIELWGASGRDLDNTKLGGKGAYTKGTINLKKDQKLYVYVGGKNKNFNAIKSGSNGNGATDVRLIKTTNWYDFDSLKSRIMVAGAGGNAHGDSGKYAGGSAGGLIGYDGEGKGAGKGGTQTHGGARGVASGVGADGGFGLGGISSISGYYTGASGYYGSGSATWDSGQPYASGGGSSYISGHEGCDAIDESSTENNIIHTGQSLHYSKLSFTDTVMIDGEGHKWTTEKKSEVIGMPTYDGTSTMIGNTGDGYAKISLISSSRDNYLSELTANHGTLNKEFNPLINEYTLTLSKYDQKFTLSGTPSDKNANITGLGSYEIGLGEEKTIEIIITAESGDTRTYVIHVIRETLKEGEHDSKLSKIEITGYEENFKPEFHPLTNEYNIVIPLDEIDLNIITETFDSEATVKITGDKYTKKNTGVITITTSAPNVEDTIYTINYVKDEDFILHYPKEYTFKYTGNYQTFIAPNTGIYKIELWGAQGGNGENDLIGGKGAYTSGTIKLQKNQQLYIEVGGQGTKGTKATIGTYNGGYNGGGNGYISRTICSQMASGGGGATDIRLLNKTEGSSSSLASRIMVSAGGGGAFSNYCGSSDYSNVHGGAAGGLEGSSAIYVSRGGFSSLNPLGGTQTTGGKGLDDWTSTSYSNNYIGKFGLGGTGSNSYSGGGAGYYGGASGTWQPGAGGSSYISGYLGSVAVTSATDVTPKSGCSENTNDLTCSYHYSNMIFEDAIMKSGNEEMPTYDGTSTMTGNTGDGYAKISLISSSRDNYLSELTANNGTLNKEFNPLINEYTLTLSKYDQNFKLSGTLSDEKASITGLGSYEIGFGEEKTIEIIITAESGDTRTYVIHVIRETLKEGEHSSKISKLEITDYEEKLNPEFHPLTTEYNIEISSNEIDLDIITETFDSEATVTISGNKYIKNITGTITITVSAPTVENTIYKVNYSKTAPVQEYLFNYKGEAQAFIAPITSKYKLEVWGAQGGSYNETYKGGYGGYSYGEIKLTENEILYINVGGQGLTSKTNNPIIPGGYNGGGNGYSIVSACSNFAGSGGGATHIATNPRALSSLENDKDSILIVAGGGGGASYRYCSNRDYTYTSGGSGGGVQGQNNYLLKSSWSIKKPTGGSQTIGGNPGNANNESGALPGTFGTGGASSRTGGYTSAAGGGGGYYGGGAGMFIGGAGGSGYISNSNLINKKMVCYDCDESSNESTKTESTLNVSETPISEYAKMGNGYAKITPIIISKDNYLTNITSDYGTLSPNFDPTEQNYTLTLDEYDKYFTLSGTLSDEKSKAIGFDKYSIEQGETKTIEIVVTAESGEVRTYTITATRKESSGHNSKLKSLDIDGYVIDFEPEFHPLTNEYNIEIPSNEIDLNIITETFDSEATVKVEGNKYIKNRIGVVTIIVSEPNVEDTIYTINYTKTDVSNEVLTYDYTGNYQIFKAPLKSEYKIELWGAQGGKGYLTSKASPPGGKGAYTKGIIKLDKNDLLYIYVGGQGQSVDSITKATGGYNGGGNGSTALDKDDAGGAGGGATDVRLVKSDDPLAFNSLTSRIMVSAGGGGAHSTSTTKYTEGLAGGALAVTGKLSTWTSTWTPIVNQVTGGAFGYGENAVATNHGGAGGGSGYYGGYTTSISGYSGMAAGGSSYISGHLGSIAITSKEDITPKSGCLNGTNDITCSYHYSNKIFNDTIMKSGNEEMPTYDGTGTMTGNSGDGYAKITTLFDNRSKNNYLTSLNVSTTNYETKEVIDKKDELNFEMTKNDYYLTLDIMETEITLSARPEDSTAKIEGLGTFDVPAGTTTFPIKVTAENGNEKVYNVHVTRAASSESYPIDIIISGLVPSLCIGNNPDFCKVDKFDKDIHEYQLVVPYRIKQLQFDVHKGHPFQTVSGKGEITLSNGLNEIIIDVTSEDGSETNRYVFHVIRDMTGDTDIEFKILDPTYELNFDSDILEYYMSVENSYSKYLYVDGNATDNVGKNPDTLKDETMASLKETIQMYIATDDPNATFVVSGPETLQTGMNDINIIVSSDSGDIKTYTLHIYRQKNENIFLSSLEVVNITDSAIKYPSTPEFNKLNLGPYQVVVEDDIEKVNIVATPEVTTSTVSGTGEIVLNKGSNKKSIIVTAENGTTETYELDIVRKKNSNNNLSDLTVKNGETTIALNPIFDKETLTYNIDVPEGTSEVTIEATPEVSTTIYKLLDSATIKVGTNVKRVMAVAEDGSNKIYTINITRPATKNNYLSELKVTKGEKEFTLTPTFNKETENYTLTVENDVTNVDITAKLENNLSKIIGPGNYSLAVGTNVINVITTSETNDVKTYKITITRKPNSNAYLSGITTSAGTLNPDFDKETGTYKITVANDVKEIEVTGIPEVETTTITGNDTYKLTTDNVNIITLTTLAEDKITTKTYTLEITREKSENTKIKNMWMEEGGLNPKFDSQVINYTARVPYEKTTATFHVELESDKATYEIIGDYNNLAVGENEITIRVKSEKDQSIYKDYTVVVTRQAEGTTSSYLNSLTVSNGTLTPTFAKETTYYEVSVPNEVEKITIEATSEDVLATITGTGEKALAVGDNIFTIKVEATDGTTREYQVKINRERSYDARLSSLILDGVELSPTFDKDVYNYNATTSNPYLDFIQVTTVDEDASFSIEGNEFTENGEYTVTIVVIAADMTTTKTYTITVNKEPNTNNDLALLEVEGYTITPNFSKDTILYTLTVPNTVNSVNVKAIPEAIKSTVDGDGIQEILVGENRIIVRVTSEIGATKEYTIVITKEGNNDNTLAALEVLNGTMTPSFDGRAEYDVEVEYSEKTLDLKVILNDPKASYTVLNNDLKVGVNKVTISVTAENGDIKSYVLNVTRKEIVSALLEDIQIKNYNTEPVFNSYVTSYNVTINNETTSLDLTPITLDKKATYKITGNENFVVGDNTVTIEVTASDGVTKETYTLNVTRQIAANTYLDYLYTDKGVLTPEFVKSVMDYSITVPNTTEKIELIGRAEDRTTTITGLGEHSLNIGENLIPVTVTATNGVKRIYYVKVIRSKNNDNFLASLVAKVGDTTYDLIPEFTPDQTEYRVELPADTESVNLVGTLSSDTAKVEGLGVHNLRIGENIINIIVTAEDGTPKTYSITINKASSDKTLKDLIIDKGYYTPKVSDAITEFDVYEYFDTDKITVEAIPNSENSLVTSGNGEVVLTSDEMDHTIIVTAEDGTTENYVLHIHRTILKDEGLKNLGLNNLDLDYCDKDKCKLNPTFDTDILNYKIKVPYEYEYLDVLAEKKNEYQTVKYKIGEEYITDYKLPMGKTTVSVEVYDGLNKLTRTYTLEVERCESSNNYLKDLQVGIRNDKTGALDLFALEPIFNKKTQEYTINVGKGVEEVEIIGIPEAEGNKVIVNGYNYLQVGNNDATITVISKDNSERTYIVHIIRDAKYNSYLENIYVSTGNFWDLTPEFSPTKFDYVTTISGSYEKAKVDAVALLPTTIITGTGEIDLKTGNNIVVLNATSAEDGSISTYRLNIIKLPSINVDLESLIVEEGTLIPEFDSGITKYEVSVGEDVDKLTIHATPKDRTSTVRITGNENLVSGDNIVNIIVTNKDNTASKTYKLIVNKAKSTNSYLSDIKVFDEKEELTLKPTFDKNTFTYDVKVPYTEEKVIIEAIPEIAKSVIEGNGEYYLNYGHNNKEIKVISESGTESIYEVDIYRAYDLYLKSITTDTGTLEPEFDKERFSYTIDVPYETKTISISAEPNSNKVKVTGNGEYTLATGENVIKIVTVDPDNNKRIHTVTVNREKNNNNYIKELTVNGYLNPIFEKTTQEYIVDVRKDVTSLDLGIVLEADDATYEVLDNGGFIEANNPSKVTIRVTAENGDIRDYILNVNLRPDEFFSNKLLDMTVKEGKLVPDFNPNVNNYTILVANSIDKLTIETIKENPYSKVTYNGGTNNTISLELGRNVIEVAVTNPEGNKNSYYIIAYREENSDASLASLNVKGFNLLPLFTRYNYSYSLDVGSETTELDIEAIPYDPKSTVQITGHRNLKTGNNEVKILVTAPDGVTQKEYVINVTKGASRNNYLSDLNITGHTFDKVFNKLDQGPYIVNVDSTVNSVMVNAIPEVATTTVTGDGAISLNSGQNIITIYATSESGDTRPYTIIVNRSKSNDSTLKNILLSDESLDPEFDKDTVEYTVNVPKDLESITITGIPNVLTSTVSGNATYQIDQDEFTVPLVVTAEDGSNTTYKVKVVRDISYSSKLQSLIVKDGELYPGFHKLITGYTILVPNEITSLTLDYLPEDPEAQVVVNNNQNFKVGTNTVTIAVTAKDGSETTTYTISVVRQPVASNYLLDLAVENQTMTPTFDKTVLFYQVEVPIDTETINIIGTVEDPTSTMSGVGLKSVKKGINRFYVTVESASGVIRTYQIEVTRKESEENKLLTLISNIGTLDPEFNSDTNSYTLSVPTGTTKVNLTGTVSENAIVTGLGEVTVPLEGTTHNIIVTSESGATNTYTIEIVRAASDNTELENLIPSAGTLEYSNDILEYTIEVSDAQNVISFTATPKNPAATVTGLDLTNLNYGNNDREIVVTAEDGVTKRTIKVTVKRMKDLISIIPSETNIVITKDEEKTITYTLNPTDTSYPDVEWVSTDPNIATVDENGKITGIEYGSTTINIVSKHDSTIMGVVNVNVINLKITSQVYDVVRFTDEEKTADPTLEEYVIGAESKYKLEDFLKDFENDPDTLHAFDANGNEITDLGKSTATKMHLKLIIEGQEYDEITIVIRGDITGDGIINAADYNMLNSRILRTITFTTIENKAADVTQEGIVNAADYNKIKSYILREITTVN